MSKSKRRATTTEPIPEPTIAGQVLDVPVARIMPNPQQPRTEFDDEEMQNLAASVRKHGILQPLIAEQTPDGMFILHAGERRLRAARMAGLTSVPVVLGPALIGDGAQQRLIRALVENVQRADMNVIEEAHAYEQLAALGLSNMEISHEMGISYARVAHRRQLLTLEDPIQNLIASGQLNKDKKVIDALQDIPDTEARIQTAKTLAERRATIKASIEACQRVAGALSAAKIPKSEVPAIRIATRKAGEMRRSIWDAFAQVGKVPPWPLMEIAVRDTCERCAMRDVASATTCKGCALVECLRQMIGETK